MQKILIVLTVPVILITLTLSSCGRLNFSSLKTNQQGKYGGTLRMSHMGQDPKTFNPWTANDKSSSDYAAMLYDGLVIIDANTDEVLPHLASSFEILDGGKKIKIKLRDDIYWTDGKPITAEDVEYTWDELIRNGVALSSLRDIVRIDGEFPEVTIENGGVVVFETKKVFAPFLKNLGISIAPKHDIEKYFTISGASTIEEKQKLFNNYLNIYTEPSLIVSSGAFKLQKIQSGERIEFIRNPNYFLSDATGHKYPYLGKIIFTYVQDSTADLFKFLAGESYVLNVTAENTSFLKTLEKNYGFKLFDEGPSTGTNFIWFNLSANIPEPKYSWFNDSNFRKAISYAVDRDSIVNNVFLGLAAPLFTAESLKSPYVHSKLMHKRDLAYAKELLSESGFRITKDKILFDKDNNRVEFSLYTNAGNKERELIASIIISNLKELGIKINFKAMEFNNFVSRVMAGKDYDAGLLSLTGSSEPNSGANVWRSDGRLHMFDIRNGEKINPVRNWELAIDEAYDRGVEVIEFDKRKVIYDSFQEIVYEQNPLIYLASPKIITAVSNKVKGARVTKYGGIMPKLWEIYVL